MCKMNKWQYLPRDLWFLKWKASENLAFGRLRTSSEDFGLLRKTSEFFGNLQKWSCRLAKSQHSQDKNLTLISQKKLAGILLTCCNSNSVLNDVHEYRRALLLYFSNSVMQDAERAALLWATFKILRFLWPLKWETVSFLRYLLATLEEKNW